MYFRQDRILPFPFIEHMVEFLFGISYCESVWRIRGVNPGSWFLPIPDPGSKNSNKIEGWKNIWCHTFLCGHKFHKIVHYFRFEVPKNKMWANFQRIIELFTQKIVTKLSKAWVWDLGSGKTLFRIPDHGFRGQKGTGSRIRIRNTDRDNYLIYHMHLIYIRTNSLL